MGYWSEGSSEIQARAHRITALLEDISMKERKDYSVCKAILSLCGDRSAVGIEKELSTAIADRLGRETAGMYIPTTLRASGLDTTLNTKGAYTVATEVRELIELLRAKTRVIQAGATVLSGLQGNQQFPKQSTASSGAWVSDLRF